MPMIHHLCRRFLHASDSRPRACLVACKASSFLAAFSRSTHTFVTMTSNVPHPPECAPVLLPQDSGNEKEPSQFNSRLSLPCTAQSIPCPKCQYCASSAQDLLAHHDVLHSGFSSQFQRDTRTSFQRAQRNERSLRSLIYHEVSIGDHVQIIRSDGVCHHRCVRKLSFFRQKNPASFCLGPNSKAKRLWWLIVLRFQIHGAHLRLAMSTMFQSF